MKNITKYIKTGFLAILLLSPMTSCSDFLDTDAPSIVTDEFYNTKEGQNRLIYSLYSNCRTVFNTGDLQYYGTDLYMAVTETNSEKMFNGYDKTFNSTAPNVADYWSVLYKIIQESNTLLSRCKPEVAGTDYNRMVAEGFFFRSLAYYYMVETFGDVPLYLEENTGVITSAKRTEESIIYAQMIKDLESVKDKLSMKPTTIGQVGNGAILSLLGKLYLTRAYKPYADASDFTNAATCFDAIINDSKSTYQLLSSYASVYDENNQNNSEVIWSIQYGNDKNYIGDGNPQQRLFGFNITALEPDMFGKVQTDYSSMSRQYWIIPSVHELYTDPILDTRYDATFKREFYINNSDNKDYGKLGLYFSRWNDVSGIDEGAAKYYPFKNGTEYTWYPQSTALTILSNAIDRMPIIQKFKDTKIEWGGKGSREDVVFRLSDTYLLSAEAHLGANENTTALERINKIRKRAALDDNAYNYSMKLSSIDIDVILDERARELLGEHDRWFDLKRTNKLIERAKKYNPFVEKYNNLNENHLVRPIPQDEMNKVKGLTQNTGY